MISDVPAKIDFGQGTDMHILVAKKINGYFGLKLSVALFP